MLNSSVTKEAVKAAFLDRDFERGQSLMREWCKQASAEMKAASGDVERRRIFEDARSFVEENIYLVRVIRAHISAELHANSASFLYADPDSEQHRWRING
jgi:hypothetical protein